jgi:hypothetical protein
MAAASTLRRVKLLPFFIGNGTIVLQFDGLILEKSVCGQSVTPL